MDAKQKLIKKEVAYLKTKSLEQLEIIQEWSQKFIDEKKPKEDFGKVLEEAEAYTDELAEKQKKAKKKHEELSKDKAE